MKQLVKKCVCLGLLCLLLTGGFLPVYAQQKINLNQATLEQLVEIKGIGEKTAQQIIDYRQSHGNFSSVDEIVNVKGVGVKKLESIREILTVSEDTES